jgi:hypothetical protein
MVSQPPVELPKCGVVIPGVGRCELLADGHKVHRVGAVTWNGPSKR